MTRDSTTKVWKKKLFCPKSSTMTPSSTFTLEVHESQKIHMDLDIHAVVMTAQFN